MKRKSRAEKLEEILVEEFMEFNPKLKVLNSNENCILAINERTKKAYFHYVSNQKENITHTYNLLSEVGKEYISTFEQMINDSGLELETQETENNYFNVLI